MLLQHIGNDSEEDDDDDIGIEEGFQNHLDALKRACVLNIGQDSFVTTGAGWGPGTPSSALEEDDEELFESIQKKYSVGLYLDKDLLTRKRPVINSDDEDDEEDDEEILRSVEKLYGVNELSGFSPVKGKAHEPAHSSEARTTSPGPELPEEITSEYGNPEVAVICATDLGRAVSTLLPSNWNEEDDLEFSPPDPLSAVVPFEPYTHHSDLLSSAEYEKLGLSHKEKIIAEALQKNGSYQQRIRIIQNRLELKQKQNAEMQRRVRTLVDFEKYCKRRYAGFFTDQANPSLKLFSARGAGYQKEASEKNDYQPSGPPDNPDVEAYRKLKQKAMFALLSRKWRMDERKELTKGVKQQVYEVLVCEAMDAVSDGDIAGDNALEDALNDIRSKELTPQDVRDALGGVNWDEIARVYVMNRTAEECRTRWLNHEDPLINKSPWTKIEDKKLLSIAQRHNTTNWETIALELGTKRTPAECLMRYQRSLNASFMRSNWTPEEDDKLRAAVEELGESDWSAVAACLEGRNNSQCLMRWYKVLHPGKHRKGRWSVEEDKRLKWAVSVYGAKKWKQIADHVPGRTDIQCRERWCNVLNPDIKVDTWTEEEDEILRESIARHGPHRWSAISADLKVRTDKQCWRRWKILFPEHQSDYQRNVFIQRNALVKNFQGRKKERPKLGPQDFVSKTENFLVSSKKGSKGPSTKERSVTLGAHDRVSSKSASSTTASDQRESNRSVRGALQEVPVNGDDGLSDPKLRRLARIHKLKLARASKTVPSFARKVPPGGDRSKVSTPGNQSEQGRDKAAEVASDKGKKRPRSKASLDQGEATKRPRHAVGRQRRSNIVGGDSESAPEPTSAVTETLASGEISCVTDGHVEVVTNSNNLESVTGKRKRRPRMERCSEHGPAVKRARPRKALSLSEESGVQTLSHEPQLVERGPEVLAFVDLVHAVNNFCRYSSVVYEEQRVLGFPGLETCGTSLVMSAEGRSGSPSSNAACPSTNFSLEKYPRFVQDHGTPLVGTECVSADGGGSRTERRMVPSIATTEGICDAIWRPNSVVNRAARLSGRVCNATTQSGSDTAAIGRGEETPLDALNGLSIEDGEENPPDALSGLSIEDEEVAAATKAILSWPFFYGVQQLMHQADEFLDAKVSRKQAAPRSSKTPGKKVKTLDVNPDSQLAANIAPVPRRSRSARSCDRMRGSVQKTRSDVHRISPGRSDSVGATADE